jgi:hypothetical protein
MHRVLDECPHGHKLEYLSSEGGGGNKDWAIYYCPKCDLPISVIGEVNAHIVGWKWVSDTGYEPNNCNKIPSEYENIISMLREKINKTVSKKREWRHSEPVRCPNDNSRIPVLAKLLHNNCQVVYLWCPYCKLGFAFMNDADYGWEYHVCFAQAEAGYEITKEYNPGGSSHYDRQWLKELTTAPPDLQTWLKNQKPSAHNSSKKPWWKLW